MIKSLFNNIILYIRGKTIRNSHFLFNRNVTTIFLIIIYFKHKYKYLNISILESFFILNR